MAEGREPPASDAAELLRWRVHPARLKPWSALAAVLFMAGVTALVQSAYHSAWLSVMAILLLGGAIGEFLFPTDYRLTTAGAERKPSLGARQSVAWPAVQVVYRFDEGLKLSTLPTPGVLEPHRGLFLRFGDERDAILRFVDERATARRRPAEGGDEREPDGD